jgi:hypothetical protein
METTYTREQILRGEGLFTSGEWTVIYRRPDGRYVTADRHERPGVNLVLVGGAARQPNGRPHPSNPFTV